MVVPDAVDVALRVHREGHPVQALVAHGAPEAARVVGLAQGLQDLGVEALPGQPGRQAPLSSPALPAAQGLWEAGEGLTISMMRCPHTLHLSAVCWNPEYWEGHRSRGGV